MPLIFQAGEAFQFDWSEDWAMIAGKQIKLQAAHTKLSHSKAFIIRVYPLQTHEMLFDAMTQAFRVLGGVPQRGVFDNMKTAVDKIDTGKARQVNARFAARASHYLFEPEFCNPASGWEKGRSRRMFRMRGVGCGRRCLPSRTLMPKRTGQHCVRLRSALASRYSQPRRLK